MVLKLNEKDVSISLDRVHALQSPSLLPLSPIQIQQRPILDPQLSSLLRRLHFFASTIGRQLLQWRSFGRNNNLSPPPPHRSLPLQSCYLLTGLHILLCGLATMPRRARSRYVRRILRNTALLAPVIPDVLHRRDINGTSQRLHAGSSAMLLQTERVSDAAGFRSPGFLGRLADKNRWHGIRWQCILTVSRYNLE